MSLKCHLAHAIHGRIRVYIEPSLFLDDEMIQGFQAFFQNQEGILECRVNKNCQCAILTYDPEIIKGENILDLIEGLSPEELKCRHINHYRNHPQDSESSSLPLILSSAAVALGVFFESPLAPWFLAGASIPIFSRAFDALSRKGKLNVDVLDASATAVMSLRHQFNTASMMVWLVSLGNFIRDTTVQQSHKAIERLFDGVNQLVWIIRDGEKIQIRVDEVQLGDEVIVYPGELIPVDGTVLTGKATVDQKILTGESMPIEKKKGSYVYSGTVVREGKLYIKAQKIGSETMKSKIIQLVNNAPTRETRIQDYAEHFADRLVPWSFIAAGTSFVTMGNIDTTASLLIVDYGTGIRIAAPTTVLSSIAKAACQGILIKGGRYLEILAGVNTIIFDKTGTLTRGEPEVVKVIAYPKTITPTDILKMAAAAEQRLTHPVAQAIVRAANQKNLVIPKRDSSEYTIGLGVEAQFEGSTVLVGCNRFMALKKIKIGRARWDIEKINGQAAAPLFVALDGKLVGLMIYTDPVCPEASQVIQALRKRGIENIFMLTGDHPAIAQKVAQKLEISRYFADVFPEEKAEVVKSLQKKGHVVAVVGDGINDTPALVQADVGIAVNGGADVATETAHVSFLEGGLWKIPQAIDIARESMHLIRQNWNINLYPNTSAIILALLGIIGPVGTTIISNGSAIVASLNALRPMLQSVESESHFIFTSE